MHRHTPRLALAALATLAFAACQDNAPTAPTPETGPVMSKGGNGNGNGNNGTPGGGGVSNPGGITPAATRGNTSDNGSECSAYGGATGVKIEDNFNQTIAGYDFRVNGGTVSFSRSSPGYAITAVLVKGGPAYDTYDYSSKNNGTTLGITADGGLTAPLVGNGKNVPDVSHYIVCYVRNIQVSKRLVAVKTSDGRGGMTADPSYRGDGQVVIPNTETRWLQFEIRYEQAPGSEGTLTEILPDLCRSAAFSCSSPDFNVNDPNSARFTVTGSGTKLITLDVTARDCKDGTLTNKVMLDQPPLWVSAEASVRILAQCVSKRLVNVYSSMGSDGMVADPTYMDGKVTIPQGQTRWLEYEISYTLGGNGSGTLSDNVQAACSALNSSRFGDGFTCTTAGFDGRGGQTATVSGTNTIRIIIDIKNDHGCGDRDFVNTAVLTRDGTGPTTSGASTPVMIWTPACR